MNYGEIKSTLLEGLRAAGELVRETIDSPAKTIEKKTELSLVTETDKKCEEIIFNIIGKRFPDHALLGEESLPQGNSESRWIVDPIDGTTNFAHGYPAVCVSIGFEHLGIMELGGVYDPVRDELFFAGRGKGAFLNDKPIRVSGTPSLSDALTGTGFPYDRRERIDEYLAIVKEFIMRCQGLRRGGSAALDLCYVACGRFDVFYEQKLQPWDKAAGMLLVEEAGGKLSDFSGGPLTLEGEQNLASNGLIHEEALALLRGFASSGSLSR